MRFVQGEVQFVTDLFPGNCRCARSLIGFWISYVSTVAGSEGRSWRTEGRGQRRRISTNERRGQGWGQLLGEVKWWAQTLVGVLVCTRFAGNMAVSFPGFLQVEHMKYYEIVVVAVLWLSNSEIGDLFTAVLHLLTGHVGESSTCVWESNSMYCIDERMGGWMDEEWG